MRQVPIQRELQQFLANTPPCPKLSANAIELLYQQAELRFFAANQEIPQPYLGLVFSGVFAMAEVALPWQPHDFFGAAISGLSNRPIVAKQSGIVISWPQSALQSDDFAPLWDYFRAQRDEQLHLLARDAPLLRPIEVICHAGVYCCEPTDTIQHAAQRMTDAQVSALVVMDGNKAIGMLTDRDLRRRVVLVGMSVQEPVSAIMSSPIIAMPHDTPAFLAMQTMFSHHIHHLPVTKDGVLYGMVTRTDFLRAEQQHPLFLVRDIQKQTSRDGLITTASRLQELIRHMNAGGASALEVSVSLTSVFDAITRKAIALTLAQLGPAPCLFSWVCFGSQARGDMLPGADQDNALILERELPAAGSKYFQQLAQQVVEILDACGQPRCPGNMIATNPQLCLSLQAWSERFSQMLNRPTPQALLDATILLDIRLIDGSQALLNALQQDIKHHRQRSDLFIRWLAMQAVACTPPLGLLNNFILDDTGEQLQGLELKKRGTSLIQDVVRVYCVAHNIEQVSLSERLDMLVQQSVITHRDRDDLASAWQVLQDLRWQTQRQQLQRGEPLSNWQDPRQLNVLNRHQLKDVFKVIREQQQRLKQRFGRDL